MAVTNRKVLQLAGSTLENIKALTGEEEIQARELLVATDTGNIVVGLGDGEYNIIGAANLGTTEEREAVTPGKGVFFYDTDLNELFVGDGEKWVSAGSGSNSGFVVDDTKDDDKTLWTADKITSAIADAVNGLSWQAPVKSVVDAIPTEPAPEKGDRYLILSDTDENADKIVEFNGEAWVATSPVDGMALFVEDTDEQYAYNGTEWVSIKAGFTYEAGEGVTIEGNKISLDTDGVSLVVGDDGKVECGDLDFGEF